MVRRMRSKSHKKELRCIDAKRGAAASCKHKVSNSTCIRLCQLWVLETKSLGGLLNSRPHRCVGRDRE